MSSNGRPIPVARSRWPILGHAPSLLRRPLEFMLSLRSYGGVVTIYLGSLPVTVLTDSALAYRVLAVDADKFGKGVFVEKLRPYFGNGLALSIRPVFEQA